MRVGRDRKAAAFRLCRPQRMPVDVEALRARVDLEPHIAARGFRGDALEVELVAIARK
jgi:hypothetical protein